MRREMQSLMRETTHAAASQNARLLLRIRKDKKAELKERNRPGKGHSRFRHHERSKETQFAWLRSQQIQRAYKGTSTRLHLYEREISSWPPGIVALRQESYAAIAMQSQCSVCTPTPVMQSSQASCLSRRYALRNLQTTQTCGVTTSGGMCC